MTVTPEDRDAMARLRNIMEGKSVNIAPHQQNINQPTHEVELLGPGQISQRDVTAMASVLSKLNNISNHVVDDIITESVKYPSVAEAIHTERTGNSIKVGRYEISIKEDANRIAGKQFYSIYNSLTNETIANDISLYETAISVIRLLNGGQFTNSTDVRKLFEQDDAYTSHKVDAFTYKRRMIKTSDPSKRDIYESRLQASMDRCMTAKKLIKELAKNVR